MNKYSKRGVIDKLVIFDPSIFSSNLGDYIIIDACNEELSRLLPNMLQVRLPTQQPPSATSLSDAEYSSYKFLCGTNLLSSNILSYNQWKYDLFKIKRLKDVILMGVGWWQYQRKPTSITRKYYQYVLHSKFLHSVRDSYTEDKMQNVGFENVVNTGCPTTWKLTESFCKTIPKEKTNTVLFTITDYKPDVRNDYEFVSLLRENYTHLYFWPQGFGDIEYIHKVLGNTTHDDITIIGPNLLQFKNFMENVDFDYIGTRLHAGILALNHKKRSMVIAVDNRASEMKIDINLPVVSRGDLKSLQTFFDDKYTTEIKIKTKEIKLWRNQFLNS